MISLLNELLRNLRKIYEESEIRDICSTEGYQWGYSLITGACVPAAPLLVGFNWGAKEGEKYESQETIEATVWTNEDLGSLVRIVPYCKKYLPQHMLTQASQTNYCFFRSKNERQITSGDLELCRPIFYRLLEIVNPSIILCFSSKLRDHLVSTDQVKNFENRSIAYDRGQQRVTYDAIKGVLATGVKIAFLPHPNYPMKKSARDVAWDFCFGKD